MKLGLTKFKNSFFGEKATVDDVIFLTHLILKNTNGDSNQYFLLLDGRKYRVELDEFLIRHDCIVSYDKSHVSCFFKVLSLIMPFSNFIIINLKLEEDIYSAIKIFKTMSLIIPTNDSLKPNLEHIDKKGHFF